MSSVRLLPLFPVRTKGDKGGFEFKFQLGHRLHLLNELLSHHTSFERTPNVLIGGYFEIRLDSR